MKNKMLFVFGTRPEAIKMAPLIKCMQAGKLFDIKICVTGQHRKMLDQVLYFFNIKPDYDLCLMKANQSLDDITSGVLKGVTYILQEKFKADYVIVHGDTTTTLAGALAAYYTRTKIIHIEAGLRSYEKYSPYPEEVNRKMIAQIADLHFAPTPKAVENLVAEGIDENCVWNVGNTVIDALLQGLAMIQGDAAEFYDNYFRFIDDSKKIILVTGHRRENFGEPFENMCNALKTIADLNSDVEIVYPVHLNPNVMEPVHRILTNNPRIHLIAPLDYSHFIWLLNMSSLVITDSGGIQEEAPSLGKPVLIMRNVTDRVEGVQAGIAKLVGTSFENIVKECMILLSDQAKYDEMANAINPYGDGTASRQIIAILSDILQEEPTLV